MQERTQELDDFLKDVYEKNKGYRIKENDVDNNLCFIYCSSNALYTKNDVDDFKCKVINSDRYEWENIRPKRTPKLEIYIRDIYLSWYVKGINKEINDFDSCINFLKTKTNNYKVRCIGASSGGYIGTMIAMRLQCECVSFAGQFSLINHFDHLKTNIYLKNYVLNFGVDKLELYTTIKNSRAQVFYVAPVKSEQDIIQMNFVKDIDNVHVIKISTNKHGVALYPFALSKFICYEKEDLMYFTNKIYNKLYISWICGGGISAIKYFAQKFLKQVIGEEK